MTTINTFERRIKMTIDVENIQVEARRVTILAYTYVKNHPILPIFISLLFILCLFLRSLFIFLFFVVPIFIFIAVSFRLIFHIHQQNLRNAKGDTYTYNDSFSRKLTPTTEVRTLDKRGYTYAHAQSVRRRNSRKNEMHVHFQEENIIVSSAMTDNALVDKPVVVEETPNEMRQVESKPTTNNRFNSDEDGNKAVEWTENDQKNLNDLGFSELERNKRLESLMAKRKARKLLTLQVRRTLMNIRRDESSSEIASILIPKMGVFENNKSSEALISPTPGSAPSVLLPVHNPFDIPYDPQEEKPNLTGYFQKDLVDNHQKDAVFCRHESFSLGTISPGPWELYSPSETRHHLEYAIRPVTQEIPEFSRFRKQSGKEEIGELTKVETSQENETIPCSNDSLDPNQQSKVCENASDLNDVHNDDGTTSREVDDDPELDTYEIYESSSSSSSEINAPFSTANKDEILRSLSFSLRKNLPVTEIDTNVRRDVLSYYENPSPFENNRKNDQNGTYNTHMRSQSLASDLQVELSEVGSQITNLSSDGESLEYEVEGNPGNEEVWVASSQLKRVEENEAKSGEVREVSEQDIIKVGFSRMNQDIEEPVNLESNVSQSVNFVDKVHEEIVSNNNMVLHQNNFENIEESYNSAENNIPMDEKIVYEINDQIDLVNDDDQGIIDLIQDTYGEDLDCTNEGTSQDLSENNLEHENSTQPEYINPYFVELHVAELECNNSQFREVVAENGPSEASSSSSTTEDKDLVRTSEFNPSLAQPIEPVIFFGIDPTPIAVIPEVEVEQVAIVSSPSSSPNSVLQHKFSVDNLAHNMSFDDINMASQQSIVNVEQNDNFREDSTAEQTHAGEYVGLQESSFPLSHSSENNTSYGTGDEPVHISDNRTDINLITPTEENEKSKQ